MPIAKDLGLNVFLTDFGKDIKDISGKIKKDTTSDSGYSIYVNEKHHSNRRRFTIAHEIAHYVLHEDKIGDGITDDALYRSGQSNLIETQANHYAAEILMPWHLITKALEMDIETLSNVFEVSKSAMSIRLGVPWETDT